MNNQFVPVNTPILTGKEREYILDCINTGWISSEGSYIKKFEEGFSTYIGRNEGIAVANGSGALDIAVQALNIGNGDEVIMPTFTIISPALSVVRTGAIPVLVDSDPITWNMDISQIESKITSKTKAIIVVHIYGLPVDIDPVLNLCKKYGLYLIEDAAEMHGQTYNGKKCGSFGDISTFSFYPNKHITTGEGGMIVTDDHYLADRCRKLRNIAFEPEGRRYIHHEMGWNYRMTNMQAAIGLAQLEKIEDHLIKKRVIGKYYTKHFKSLKAFQYPLESTSYAENIYWVYGLVAKNEKAANKSINYLNDNGVGNRQFFWCMHEQPVFKTMGLFQNEKYPIAENMARNGFYIPSGLGLNEDQMDYVINTVKNLDIWLLSL
jgi:perosamine synthetase